MAIYFAYGSNLLSQRLLERTPDAKPIGAAKLAGYALRFHKIGDDGSGKCDAYFMGDGHELFGVMYEMSDFDLEKLDGIEGEGYQRIRVTVLAEEPVDVFTYVVKEEFIDPDIQPYAWYKNFVLAGAREHDLPDDYMSAILAAPFKIDPDEDRRLLNHGILTRSGLKF